MTTGYAAPEGATPAGSIFDQSVKAPPLASLVVPPEAAETGDLPEPEDNEELYEDPIDARIAEAVEAVGGTLSLENVQGLIARECDVLKELLLRKNRQYGNSALEPLRVFSKASTVEQLCVRIDDKLSRIRNTGLEAADEDTLLDLQGYITLLRVARRLGLG